MSWLSSAIGKIPLIGRPINEVGKILPSGGQLLGGAMLGPVGSVLGGAIDGNTTPLQKNVGNTIAGAEGLAGGGVGLSGLLGGGAAATGSAAGSVGAGAAGRAAAGAPTSLAGLLGQIPGIGGLLSGLVGAAGGGSGLIDKGLGAAELLNASNLAKQSTGYAKNAMDTANQSYDSRAPLRLSGIQGMLNPKPSSDLSGLSSVSAAGNPFAQGRVGSPMPLRNV